MTENISPLPELHYSVPRQAIVPTDGSDSFVIDCERCHSHELPQAIVLAANAFPKLVEALEKARDALKYAARFLRPEDADRVYIKNTIVEVEEALAKGEPHVS